jgi:hypothetical protein
VRVDSEELTASGMLGQGRPGSRVTLELLACRSLFWQGHWTRRSLCGFGRDGVCEPSDLAVELLWPHVAAR